MKNTKNKSSFKMIHKMNNEDIDTFIKKRNLAVLNRVHHVKKVKINPELLEKIKTRIEKAKKTTNFFNIAKRSRSTQKKSNLITDYDFNIVKYVKKDIKKSITITKIEYPLGIKLLPSKKIPKKIKPKKKFKRVFKTSKLEIVIQHNYLQDDKDINIYDDTLYGKKLDGKYISISDEKLYLKPHVYSNKKFTDSKGIIKTGFKIRVNKSVRNSRKHKIVTATAIAAARNHKIVTANATVRKINKGGIFTDDEDSGSSTDIDYDDEYPEAPVEDEDYYYTYDDDAIYALPYATIFSILGELSDKHEERLEEIQEADPDNNIFNNDDTIVDYNENATIAHCMQYDILSRRFLSVLLRRSVHNVVTQILNNYYWKRGILPIIGGTFSLHNMYDYNVIDTAYGNFSSELGDYVLYNGMLEIFVFSSIALVKNKIFTSLQQILGGPDFFVNDDYELINERGAIVLLCRGWEIVKIYFLNCDISGINYVLENLAQYDTNGLLCTSGPQGIPYLDMEGLLLVYNKMDCQSFTIDFERRNFVDFLESLCNDVSYTYNSLLTHLNTSQLWYGYQTFNNLFLLLASKHSDLKSNFQNTLYTLLKPYLLASISILDDMFDKSYTNGHLQGPVRAALGGGAVCTLYDEHSTQNIDDFDVSIMYTNANDIDQIRNIVAIFGETMLRYMVNNFRSIFGTGPPFYNFNDGFKMAYVDIINASFQWRWARRDVFHGVDLFALDIRFPTSFGLGNTDYNDFLQFSFMDIVITAAPVEDEQTLQSFVVDWDISYGTNSGNILDSIVSVPICSLVKVIHSIQHMVLISRLHKMHKDRVRYDVILQLIANYNLELDDPRVTHALIDPILFEDEDVFNDNYSDDANKQLIRCGTTGCNDVIYQNFEDIFYRNLEPTSGNFMFEIMGRNTRFTSGYGRFNVL